MDFGEYAEKAVRKYAERHLGDAIVEQKQELDPSYIKDQLGFYEGEFAAVQTDSQGNVERFAFVQSPELDPESSQNGDGEYIEFRDNEADLYNITIPNASIIPFLNPEWHHQISHRNIEMDQPTFDPTNERESAVDILTETWIAEQRNAWSSLKNGTIPRNNVETYDIPGDIDQLHKEVEPFNDW
jgi:hypothetical protein